VTGFSLGDLIREFPYFIRSTSKVFYRSNKIPGEDGMYSQRKKERRGFSGKTSFPLVTNGGYLVEDDRRSIPDRRMGNIHLELIDAANYGFSEGVTTTPLYSSGKENY
jgi:hypothetical protein